MPDKRNESLAGLQSLIKKNSVHFEFIFCSFAKTIGYRFRKRRRPQCQSSRPPAVMVFEQVLMPAVTGQLPYIGEAFFFIVKRLTQQGGHRVVGPPKKTADILKACFLNQLQHRRLSFERINESAGRPNTNTFPFKDTLDNLFAYEDFFLSLLHRNKIGRASGR